MKVDFDFNNSFNYSTAYSKIDLNSNSRLNAQALVSTALQSTQAADAAKAYLRSVLAVDLLNKLPSSELSTRTNDDSNLCDALCAAHLGTRGFKFTLSVLAAEAPNAVTSSSNSNARVAVELRCKHLLSTDFECDENVSPLERLLQATGEDASRRSKALKESLLNVASDAAKATADMAIVTATLQAQAENQTIKTKEIEILRQGSTLQSKLAAIDKQHNDFAILQRELSERKPSTAASTLASIRSEMRSQFEAELTAAIATARAEEADRIRSEERIKSESALEAQKALFHSLRTQESLELASADESLRKARDEASRGAHELRQRLSQDIDTVSVRESQLRRAHQLEIRALQLESERKDDELRRMSLRVRESDEASRSAESKFKLQFERWRNEYILGLEARESEVSRSESALSRLSAELQSERKTLGMSASKLPTLELELEMAQKERDRLKSQLSHEIEKASVAARQRDEYASLWSEEKSRSQRALDKLESAESAAVLHKTKHDAAVAEATSQRNEWTSAIKMLRNRLSEASARLSSQDEKILHAEDEWARQIHVAVEEERMRFDDAQRVWMLERAKLISERDTLSLAIDVEAKKADEANASLTGAHLRLNELDKSIAVMRASTASSSASAVGGSSKTRGAFSNASLLSSERSSPNVSFMASFHNAPIAQGKQIVHPPQRRFSANPVLMHALEVFNNAGDPLEPQKLSSSLNTLQVDDPLLISSSLHEKQQNERRELVETAVAAAIATLNHQSKSTHPTIALSTTGTLATVSIENSIVPSLIQRETQDIASINNTNVVSARPPLPPPVNLLTSKFVEFVQSPPETSTPIEEKVTTSTPIEAIGINESRNHHSPAGEAAAEAASALLSETFGGHQRDWGQTVLRYGDNERNTQNEEIDAANGSDDIQTAQDGDIQTELFEEESLYNADFY